MTLLRPAPALARRLLEVLTPRPMRDDVAANLGDLHALRARRHGQWRADAWYCWQALSLPARLRLSGDLRESRPFTTRTEIMKSIAQDLRFALRLHRAQPLFAIVAVLSLAVGIGLNTAVFSVINSVLLQPAPFENLDRLVIVWETDRDTGTSREPGSLPDFLDYRDRAGSLERLGALIAREANIAPPDGEPTRVASLRVSHELLPLLGVTPIAGRSLLASDTEPGAAPVVLISESLWARRFNRDLAVAGRRIAVDEQPFTVVGVVPDATDFGVLQVLSSAAYSRSFADRGTRVAVDLWTPLVPNPQALPRSTHPLFMVGRLAPGVSVDSAQQELTGIAADLESEFPADNRGRGVNVESLGDVVLAPVRPALFVLLGAVGLVLLVACVNVANLLLARGAWRQREVAVRAALGAGRSRLVRQFLVESVALALVAGLVGVGLAYGAVAWVVTYGPADVPRLALATLDLTVLSVTLVVSIATGLLFGLAPALHAGMTTAPNHTLTGEASRSATAGRARARLRSALVVAELGLAVVLVIGAGLLLRSFSALQGIDPGFSTGGVVKAEFQLPGARYPVDFAVWPDFAEIHAFNARLAERAAAIPGLTAVAVAGNHPLDPGFTNSFSVVGREAESRTWPEISIRRVTSGYFDVVDLEVTRGRALQETDTTGGAPVLLINEAAADRFFPGTDPLGHEMSIWGTDRRIVGVVADELFQGLTADRPLAAYLPLSQAPSTNGQGVLLVRTDQSDPSRLAPDLARAIRAVDPALAAFGIERLDETKARAFAEDRFLMTLLSLFALMALGLAAVGIHGVLSYGVSERTRELGLRLALGATPGQLRRLVVWRGLMMSGLGALLGIGGALALAQVFSSLLYSVTPTDPTTFAAVVAVLIAVAVVASYLPARRITRIDPGRALRADQ